MPLKIRFRTSFFVLLSLSFVLAEGRSPVIFIPGDGGSQLEAKLNKSTVVHYLCQKTADFYNIWLNKELLVPLVIDCWIDNVKLIYDNVTRKTYDPPGVTIRVPGWGDSEPVEWLDPSHASVGAYFKDIGNALVELGYERNNSIRGAPYDFRRAPNENGEFFIKLKALVEETFTRNNNSKVTLLSHSMGGPMTLYFLQQQSSKWKNQYVERLVTLAAPWGGAMKAVKVFAIGDDLGAFFLRESILREEQITCPSLSWLLPSPLFWKENEVLVQTDKFNYTIKDLDKFFNDLNFVTGWEMRKDTIKYSMDFSPPGVDVHCLYGTSMPTVERLDYKPGTWLDGYPTLVNGDGDGTVIFVPLKDASIGLNLRNTHGTQKQSVKLWKVLLFRVLITWEFFSDKRVLDYLKELLNK